MTTRTYTSSTNIGTDSRPFYVGIAVTVETDDDSDDDVASDLYEEMGDRLHEALLEERHPGAADRPIEDFMAYARDLADEVAHEVERAGQADSATIVLTRY